jgi:SAM-dependent methyltransferase
MVGMVTAEYKRLLTAAYDLDKPQAPQAEVDRWVDYARVAAGPVVEVMCGSGRLLVPLAIAGVDIDGIDASADMLAACKRKCMEHSVSPALQQQLSQDLAMSRRYALAFVTAGSFGLLVDATDYRRTLVKLFDHLERGGRLVLDVETSLGAPTDSGGWLGRWWKRRDGAIIASRTLSRYDPEKRVEDGLGIYELWIDGVLVESELNNWVRRFWTADELEHELQVAGFTNVVVNSVHNDAVLVAEAVRPG